MSDNQQLNALADYLQQRKGVNERVLNDPLQALWQSTRELHGRFNVQPTIYVQIPLILEETAEAIKAGLFESRQAVVGEIADVIVVTLGLAMALGIPDEDVIAGIHETIRKNDGKTTDTHYLNPANKIARKT